MTSALLRRKHTTAGAVGLLVLRCGAGAAVLRTCGLGLGHSGVVARQGAAVQSAAHLHFGSIHLSFCTGCTRHVKAHLVTCDIPLQTLMFVEALSCTRAGYGHVYAPQPYIRRSCGGPEDEV